MADNLVQNAVLKFISRAMIAGVKTNVFTRRGLEFFSREAILEVKEITLSQVGIWGTCNKIHKGRG